MPAPTTRYNLPHFDDSSAFDPIQAPFNAISDALEGSLDAAFPRAADLTALAAITGMPNSALARVTEGGALFSYDLATTKWVQQTRAVFASDAARDSAYAKASGAYRTGGAEATTNTGLHRYATASWAGGVGTVGTGTVTIDTGSTRLTQLPDGTTTLNLFTSSGTLVINNVIGTLPVGFRPDVASNGSVVGGGFAFPGVVAAAMRVYDNGNVLFIGPSSQTTFIGSVTFKALV